MSRKRKKLPKEYRNASAWHRIRNIHSEKTKKRIRQNEWSKILEDIHFLLVHGSPYSIHDYNSSTQEQSGCPGLLDEIVTHIRPRIHLFGHMPSCHSASLYKSEDNRILYDDKIKVLSNETLFINLAIYQGRTLGQPIIIDYFY